MNKTWEYSEPIDPENGNWAPIYKRITSYEIILLYWMYWSDTVFKNRPDNTFLIDVDNCIDDWVADNWAYEVVYD